MGSTRDIAEFWKTTFPGCPPVAYLLRHSFPSRWVRVHSLPDSKRYPEDESEMAIVLDRHNAVLDYLAPAGEELVLLSTGYSDSAEPVASEVTARGLFPSEAHWQSIPMHQVLPDDWDWPEYWHVSACPVVWQRGVFDSVLRLVAQCEVRNVMIGSIGGQWIYHPYDGGADVVLSTERQRNAIKDKFADWLSKHPQGL